MLLLRKDFQPFVHFGAAEPTFTAGFRVRLGLQQGLRQLTGKLLRRDHGSPKVVRLVLHIVIRADQGVIAAVTAFLHKEIDDGSIRAARFGNDMEGDATALYLRQQLLSYPVRVTRLARGLPVGSDLEYADQNTLLRALAGRQEIS